MAAVRTTLLAASLVLSCAPTKPSVSTYPGNSTGGSGATALTVEAPPVPVDVAGWREWPKANARRFRSKGHGYLWVDVHVDKEHTAAYRGGRTSAVSPGFSVVMAGYESIDGETPTGLTVMAKMPAGFDPERGDWFYAVYDAVGASATLGGKLTPCAGCHVAAREKDYLFGVVAKDDIH